MFDIDREMIETLRELVRIPSVTRTNITKEAPLGAESARVLQKALEICQGLGFRTKNCENLTGWAEIGSGEEMVGILCHLDVVPAGDGWDYDPFDLTEDNGRLYGRGTMDDKGPAAACIYAMKSLLDKGCALKRRIRIIFGTSEETGAWEDIEYYKSHEELPTFGITPDADYPAICGEKGIMNLRLTMPLEESGFLYARAGNAVNVVPGECTVRYLDAAGQEQELTEVGIPSHASLPEGGVNAITKCMEKLEQEGMKGFPQFYMESIGWDLHGGLMGCPLEDEKSGKLTMNAGVLRTGKDCITLDIDVRCPIDASKDDVISAVQAHAAPYNIQVAQTEWKPPVYKDKNGPLVRTLVETYREMTGEADAQATVIGGGTYARGMDNIVAFGAAFPGQENREHMHNEYVPVEIMKRNRLIYERALERLANADFKEEEK